MKTTQNMYVTDDDVVRTCARGHLGTGGNGNQPQKSRLIAKNTSQQDCLLHSHSNVIANILWQHTATTPSTTQASWKKKNGAPVSRRMVQSSRCRPSMLELVLLLEVYHCCVLEILLDEVASISSLFADWEHIHHSASVASLFLEWTLPPEPVVVSNCFYLKTTTTAV